jgi:hypothetical protein
VRSGILAHPAEVGISAGRDGTFPAAKLSSFRGYLVLPPLYPQRGYGAASVILSRALCPMVSPGSRRAHPNRRGDAAPERQVGRCCSGQSAARRRPSSASAIPAPGPRAAASAGSARGARRVGSGSRAAPAGRRDRPTSRPGASIFAPRRERSGKRSPFRAKKAPRPNLARRGSVLHPGDRCTCYRASACPLLGPPPPPTSTPRSSG